MFKLLKKNLFKPWCIPNSYVIEAIFTSLIVLKIFHSVACLWQIGTKHVLQQRRWARWLILQLLAPWSPLRDQYFIFL